MPHLQHCFSSGARTRGGAVSYPSGALYEEVACVASAFHWSLEDILNLDHSERRRWVFEIGKLKQHSTHDEFSIY